MQKDIEKMTDYRNCILEKLLPTLRSIIKTDYVVLDVCLITNVGDLLIWQAFDDIKKHIPHKCLYTFGIETYKTPNISRDTTLVFMGGGNFGDLWERHSIFRHRVMSEFPNNPIVQLPQSVWWESAEKMQEDINCFANHKGEVHICLRDKTSYEIIKNKYVNVSAYLLPDLALALDIKGFCKKHNIQFHTGNGSLLIRRNDKEQVDMRLYNIPSDVIEHDWLPMSQRMKVQQKSDKYVHWLSKIPHSGRLRRLFIQNYFHRVIMPEYIKISIEDMMNYKTVYSTRLHGGVLSFLLNKGTFFIDNSYKKISGVYIEWMSNCENVKLL